MQNPFFHGNPVPSPNFLNRTRELRRVVGRITNSGQSTALVGEPRTGKTSLLEYVRARENQADLYGEDRHKLIFSFIDCMTLPVPTAQAAFWRQALEPLAEELIVPHPNSRIAQKYHACVSEDYGNYGLERLFDLVRQAQYRLVLLLDEFDVLITTETQNPNEFFGGLRAVSTRSKGALTLVTASRQPLSKLNGDTQDINPTGSPYFNFLDEITLTPFSQETANTLLAKGAPPFIRGDKTFVKDLAGGHPYLLQVAASELWDAYEDGEPAPLRRRELAGEKLYEPAAKILRDTWRLWSPAMRKAFMAVALDHDQMTVLDDRVFDLTALLRDLHDYELELTSLKKQGYIVADGDYASGYRVRPGIFVRWCNDELRRAVRSQTAFEQWIQAQEWSSLLKRGQRKQLENAGRALRDFVRDGGALSGLGKVLFGGK